MKKSDLSVIHMGIFERELSSHGSVERALRASAKKLSDVTEKDLPEFEGLKEVEKAPEQELSGAIADLVGTVQYHGAPKGHLGDFTEGLEVGLEKIREALLEVSKLLINCIVCLRKVDRVEGAAASWQFGVQARRLTVSDFTEEVERDLEKTNRINSIATAVVDKLLPPKEMPCELERHSRGRYLVRIGGRAAVWMIVRNAAKDVIEEDEEAHP